MGDKPCTVALTTVHAFLNEIQIKNYVAPCERVAQIQKMGQVFHHKITTLSQLHNPANTRVMHGLRNSTVRSAIPHIFSESIRLVCCVIYSKL